MPFRLLCPKTNCPGNMDFQANCLLIFPIFTPKAGQIGGTRSSPSRAMCIANIPVLGPLSSAGNK